MRRLQTPAGTKKKRKKAALPRYATGQVENLRNVFDLSNRFIVHCSWSLPVYIVVLLLGLEKDFSRQDSPWLLHNLREADQVWRGLGGYGLVVRLGG